MTVLSVNTVERKWYQELLQGHRLYAHNMAGLRCQRNLYAHSAVDFIRNFHLLPVKKSAWLCLRLLSCSLYYLYFDIKPKQRALKKALTKKLQCNYIVNMQSISFEWDSRKNSLNKSKHGITFEEAQTVFVDENALLIHDPDHSDDEDRFILLGLSSKFLMLLVCHCYQKNDEVIRIISAREATRKEQKQYWER